MVARADSKAPGCACSFFIGVSGGSPSWASSADSTLPCARAARQRRTQAAARGNSRQTTKLLCRLARCGPERRPARRRATRDAPGGPAGPGRSLATVRGQAWARACAPVPALSPQGRLLQLRSTRTRSKRARLPQQQAHAADGSGSGAYGCGGAFRASYSRDRQAQKCCLRGNAASAFFRLRIPHAPTTRRCAATRGRMTPRTQPGPALASHIPQSSSGASRLTWPRRRPPWAGP